MSNAVPNAPHVDPDVLEASNAPNVAEAGVIDLGQVRAQDDTIVHAVLSRNQFLRQLRVEKRRSDRSKAPLSMILFRVDEPRGLTYLVTELLDLLRQNQRETDLVGYLGNGKVALLLTHTDAGGLQTVARKLAARSGPLAYTATSGTYPDQVFDSLSVADRRDSPDTLPYFLDTDTEHGDLQLFAKRCIDVVGALVLLVLASPLMLATAAAVKLTSPGPVVFRQVRLGRHGVPFLFFKFRSMRVNMDDRIHREYVASLIEGKNSQVDQGNGKKPWFKLKADPRITPIGRFIRKTSIDELPQLFNVLKGEMSLVGPRPPIPYETDRYQAWHLRRLLEVRPGITGLWQVEGRSRVSFDDMVRLDLRYARTWSLWLDVRILLKTVLVVLRRDGAD